MFLPPFQIRNLYGHRHGIIHITAPRFDSTIKSHPDAALTYLDDDDGETITVGSSFELQQRLGEPVPPQSNASGSSLEYDTISRENLHIFDVSHSAGSLATWRDHEAYSSKSLRSDSLSIQSQKTSSDDEMYATSSEPPKAKASHDLQPKVEDADTELDQYEHVLATNTEDAAPNPTDGPYSEVPASQKETITENPSEKIEDAFTNALEGLDLNFDSHIETLADFLQHTSKALRLVARKTQESDTSAVEKILDGFKNIFTEVGKLGKSMLESIDSEASVNTILKSPSEKEDTGSNSAQNSTNLSSELEPVEDVNTTGSTHAVSETPAAIAHEIFATDLVTSGDILAEKQPQDSKLDESNRLPNSQLDKLYHIQSSSVVENQSNKESADYDPFYERLSKGGFNPDSNRTWIDERLANWDIDDKFAFSEKKVDFVIPQVDSSYGRIVRPRETANSAAGTFPRSILDLESSDPDFSARFPPLMSGLRNKSSRHSLRNRSKSPERRARTRQEALSRYPSLQQLEGRNRADRGERTTMDNSKGKQPGEKHERSESKPISQMHRAWFNDHDENLAPTKQSPLTPALRKKPADWWEIPRDLTEDSTKAKPAPRQETLEKPYRPSFFVPATPSTEHTKTDATNIINSVGRDIAEASQEIRRLPGAWPEPHNETKYSGPSTVPEESSGAFFNRMTGTTGTTGASGSSTPQKIPDGHPTLFYNETVGRWSSSRSSHGPNRQHGLSRAQSVAALNPAARLTRPFDPLATDANRRPLGLQNWSTMRDLSLKSASTTEPPPMVSPHHEFSSGVPRRNATERMAHRRRPFSHRYSGAGRLPWETFEDDTRDRNSTFGQVRLPTETRESTVPPPPKTPEYITPAELHQAVAHTGTPLRHRASTPHFIQRADNVKDCVRQLINMGFGVRDPNDNSRLNVYAAASAAGGDVIEAVEMIEEDRKAGEALTAMKNESRAGAGISGWL